MNVKEVRTIIGIIGNVLSLFISLSHTPKFIQIYKKKSVHEDFQQYRHVAMVVKCSLWVLYGLPLVQKDGILVTISNGVGLVVEVIYLVVILIYCDKESERMKDTGGFLVVAIVLLFVFDVGTLWFLESLSARRKAIGVVCTVYTIIMHVSLAPYCCRYMPSWFSFVNFINAGIWIAYSVIYKIDIYVLVINVLGALASANQLILMCFSTCPYLLLPKKILPSANDIVV